MALTITSPSALVFAGNPVIFSGSSDITANKFPCVLATFSCSGYSENYTYPLSSSGAFSFDFSDALCEVFRQKQVASIGSSHPTHSPSVLSFSVAFYEQYYLDGVIYKSNATNKTGFKALPGGLTDAERIGRSTDSIAELIGSSKVLSRKPSSGDYAVRGVPHVAPSVSVSSGSASISYVWSNYGVSTTVYITDEEYAALSQDKRAAYMACTDEAHSGMYEKTVTDNALPSVPDDGSYFPLVFWNQFGLLESAVAHAKPSFQHNLSTTAYEVNNSHDYSSLSQQKAHTTLDQQIVTLSSGIVSRDWYEWWIAEVLTTPQLFVYLSGNWYSASIVASSSIKYDTSKGEALYVDFAVKLSVKGSIYNSFV